MRVFRLRNNSSGINELTHLFKRSKIYLHGLKLKDGDRIILDIGEALIGPATVISHTTQQAVIQMDDDFNYYSDTDADEVDISELEPILMPYDYYESVTGNIYLDGFLRAAYQDNNSLMMVDISDRFQGLVNYYSKAMDDAGISYQKIEDAFIIEDSDVVVRIFDEWAFGFPVKYAVGYLCAFIQNFRLYTHDNPLYSKYQIIVSNEYDADIIIELFYTIESERRGMIHTLFGIMDPLRALIDGLEHDEDKDDLADIVNDNCGIGQIVFMKLITMMFDYGGYHPEYTDDGLCILVRKDKYLDDEKFKIGFSESCSDSDYVMLYNDGNPTISKMDGGVLSQSHSIFYSNVFDFGTEMSSYFEILFKRL